MRPHGLLCQAPLSMNSPGRNTGVGSHSLLQGIFPNPGIEPRSSALQADSLLSPHFPFLQEHQSYWIRAHPNDLRQTGRTPREDEARDGGDGSTSWEMPTTSKPPEARRQQRTYSSLQPLEGASPAHPRLQGFQAPRLWESNSTLQASGLQYTESSARRPTHGKPERRVSVPDPAFGPESLLGQTVALGCMVTTARGCVPFLGTGSPSLGWPLPWAHPQPAGGEVALLPMTWHLLGKRLGFSLLLPWCEGPSSFSRGFPGGRCRLPPGPWVSCPGGHSYTDTGEVWTGAEGARSRRSGPITGLQLRMGEPWGVWCSLTQGSPQRGERVLLLSHCEGSAGAPGLLPESLLETSIISQDKLCGA